MAKLRFHATGLEMTQDEAIQAELGELGIQLERWPLRESVSGILAKTVLDGPDKTELLNGYEDMLGRFKDEGFPEADVVALHPDVPDLDAMLAKFDKEHFHTDDEIRFVAAGEGVFGFNPDWDKGPIDLLVQAGDFINVPKDMWHWFKLTFSRRIVALRFFQDTTGWTPHYREAVAKEAGK